MPETRDVFVEMFVDGVVYWKICKKLKKNKNKNKKGEEDVGNYGLF
jgi:hypothetical protein